MNKGRVGEDRGSKEKDGCPLTSISRQLYIFTVIIPLDSSTSSSLYPLVFVGCWWDLRRDSSFSYLCIIQ
jgi:hypothetical protein